MRFPGKQLVKYQWLGMAISTLKRIDLWVGDCEVFSRFPAWIRCGQDVGIYGAEINPGPSSMMVPLPTNTPSQEAYCIASLIGS
jgi:hypothetical protein